MRRTGLVAVLLLITSVGLTQQPQEAPQKWAVVIGVAVYQDSRIEVLTYAQNDARAFREHLIQYCGFPYDHVKLLTGREATKANIEEAFTKWLPGKVKANDFITVYFSGHGTQVPDKNGDEKKKDPTDTMDEAVAPYDAKADDPDSLIIDDDFQAWLGKLPTKNIVLVWDSCQTGPTSKGFAFADTKGFAFAQTRGGPATGEMADDFADWAFLAAVSPGQASYEDKALKSGAFTAAVLQALRGERAADKNGDGRVTLEEVYEYVVVKLQSYGNPQTPQLVCDNQALKAAVLAFAWPKVVRVEADKLVLSAGSGDGIEAGEEFDVLPADATPSAEVMPIARARVESVVATEATARIEQKLSEVQVGQRLRPVIPPDPTPMGRLMANSTPRGLLVFVDGECLGPTPRVKRIAAGEHMITLVGPFTREVYAREPIRIVANDSTAWSKTVVPLEADRPHKEEGQK